MTVSTGSSMLLQSAPSILIACFCDRTCVHITVNTSVSISELVPKVHHLREIGEPPCVEEVCLRVCGLNEDPLGCDWRWIEISNGCWLLCAMCGLPCHATLGVKNAWPSGGVMESPNPTSQLERTQLQLYKFNDNPMIMIIIVYKCR